MISTRDPAAMSPDARRAELKGTACNAFHPDHMSADERLNAVARLLAEGLLRARMRAFRRRGRERNSLELSAHSSAHVLETSRNGERP